MTADDRLLRRLVAAHLPVDPDRVRLEPIGTGKHNRSFYVDAGREQAVLRIAPPQEGMLFYERDMMAQQPELHALLRAETDVPEAEIYAYDDSHALIEDRYLLYEVQKYIPILVWRRGDLAGAQRYRKESLRLALTL